MLNTVQVTANAKLNLSLKVLDKRSDGYHEIESVFQQVPLYDTLKITRLHSNSVCSVICDSMLLPPQNTITKTYDALREKTGLAFGVEVVLQKMIPAGAGLGGGSSDAAAFLRALNTMFDMELDYGCCLEIASQVGSDVPFFLTGGITADCFDENTCAVISGRGEKIRKIPARKDLFFVLICPDVHCSTAEAYKMIDENLGKKKDAECPALCELEQMYRMPVTEWSFANSFTYCMANKHPKIRQALADLSASGAGYAQMSGSGSSVFGVFENRSDAEKAGEELSKEWDKCFTLVSR